MTTNLPAHLLDLMSDFLRYGEPARSVTLVGAGPRGCTLRSDERSTLTAYLAMP
ncbi:MAG: hypothetical protein ACYTGC_05075 [Planctomycetota bacterium]|jgi:hypothetical protein